MLQEIIKKDMVEAARNRRASASILKYTLGEFSRLKGTKDGKELITDKLTDTQAIRVIKRIIDAENKVIELGATDTGVVFTLTQYLPKLVSEAEIKEWLNTNVDFTTLKNKMQAVGMVKKAFGDSVDAKVVSKLIMQM